MGQMEDDPHVEACRRWAAAQDAQWWRRMRVGVIALAALCGVAVAYVCINLLLLSASYYARLLGLQPNVNSSISTAVSYAGLLAILAAVILGVQRVRAVTFPPELVLALDAADAYRLQLQAQRRALYRTLLLLAGPSMLLTAVCFGLNDAARFNLASWSVTPSGALSWQEWLIIAGYTALHLLFIGGPLVCVLEWQLLLLLRVPPRPGVNWLQALPLALWFLPEVVRYLLIARLVTQASYAFPRDAWLFILQPLGLLAGLVLAPRVWRWAAQSLGPRRWLALGGVCAAGILAPLLIYAAGVPNLGDRPGLYALLPLTAACRGLYVGNTMIGNTTGDLVADDDPAPGTDPLPGLRLLPMLFIPLWLAAPLAAAYYAYSYWVLRRAGADPPPGYRGAWD